MVSSISCEVIHQKSPPFLGYWSALQSSNKLAVIFYRCPILMDDERIAKFQKACVSPGRCGRFYQICQRTPHSAHPNHSTATSFRRAHFLHRSCQVS
ncbi:hypothetical protein PILCRDRAFT_136334 [Piloderma croceum F 1598]|uniref:Uncharacterized protein n=1 Tax=Piloderma croceum (strain F 1598) TaxID=765440 RepID=A0A0C3CPS4_PILCF|nr:hypothetical protein PILCRDRAFT_136334 [Piloderma croceum F 1598]